MQNHYGNSRQENTQIDRNKRKKIEWKTKETHKKLTKTDKGDIKKQRQAKETGKENKE